MLAWPAPGCRSHPPAPVVAPRVERAEREGAEAVVELSEAQLANVEIRVEAIRPESLAPQLVAAATIASDPVHLARVGPRMAGRIVAIYPALGQQVRAGQPLLGIDTVEFHDTSREYFQSLARSRAADEALARAQRLLAAGAGSAAEVERAEATASAERAALHEAEEHLHALGLGEHDIQTLRSRTTHGETHSRVLSPISGRVVRLDVTLGQVVAGTEELITVADLATVWAVMQIYERDLPHVAQGTAIEVTVESYPGRVFRGEVTFVGALVDPATRTLEVRARIANDDGALRPGMAATAAVRVASGPPVLMLPVDAVQSIEGRRVVFVQTAPRRYALRAVQVGAEQGGRVPVRAGLAAGEQVVVQGAFVLRGEHERAELEQE